eukprot:COSAG02_NODE_4256_length_5579_cov_2.549453_3_plen_1065_part_00
MEASPDQEFTAQWMDGAKAVATFRWPDCKPIDFFGAFFSDSSKFQEETHRKRGDKNCSCERWAPTTLGFHSRERRFSTGYETPLGELGACQMRETQRVKVLPAAATVLMVNTMNLAGVPYCDYYEVHTQFLVTTAKDGIEVRVFQAISWLKSTWLKSKISNVAYERCVDSFKVWPQNSLPTLRAYVAASRKPLPAGAAPQLVPSLEALLATSNKSISPRPRSGSGRQSPSPVVGAQEGDADQLRQAAESAAADAGPEPGKQTGRGKTEESEEPFLESIGGEVDGSSSLPSVQRSHNDRWSLLAGDEAWWSAPSPHARRGDRDVVRITIVGDSVDCCAGLVRQFANASLPRDETAADTAGASQFDATDPFAWVENAAGWWQGNGDEPSPPADSQDVISRLRDSQSSDTRANDGLIGLDGSCLREVSLHAQSANVLLSVWDTDRPARDQSSCDAAIVLYDVTNRESFHHAEDWARRVRAQDVSDGDKDGPIISLVGTHADVAILDGCDLANLLGLPQKMASEPEPEPEPGKHVIPLRLEPAELGEFEPSFYTSESAPEELLPTDPEWDTASDDSFFDAIEHNGGLDHSDDQNDSESENVVAVGLVGTNRSRRVVTLEEGEMLAGRIAARSHFELPAPVGTKLSPLVPSAKLDADDGMSKCGHPVTQVVYSLLSDLLLGDGWHPELLATRQRLAWAVVALPHHLPPRLPLTTVMHVAHMLGRCASRPVLTRERLSEAEQWHRRGQYERALEGYAHVLVAAGKDEAVEAAMRRAEAARWRQSHDEAVFGGDTMLGGITPPSSSLAAATTGSKSGWWLWVDDSYSSECFRCRLPFTFFRRRHHCRHCGHLFCGACSDKLASGLWRIPPSPRQTPLDAQTAATAAGASANEVSRSSIVLGLVRSEDEEQTERLDKGVREFNLERVCRGCWKVLRNAEQRAKAAEPSATIQQVQEASLRRRAAQSAADFLAKDLDGPDPPSSFAIVQFLYAHASRRFCESRGLTALTRGHGVASVNLRTVACAHPRPYWVSVFREFLDILAADAKQAATLMQAAPAAGTPRSISISSGAAM